jgi:hypothetical protein
MDASVVRLGAWCDFETEDEARQRFPTGAADSDAALDEPVDERAGPQPGRYAPYVPLPGTPVLSPGGIHFRVEEFAVLADGRRIRLHAERGFSLSGGVDPWEGLTLENMEANVRTTVLPDDAEDTGEDHPWDWLAALLRAQGIHASVEQLRAVPYGVEFSDRVRARVSAGA